MLVALWSGFILFSPPEGSRSSQVFPRSCLQNCSTHWPTEGYIPAVTCWHRLEVAHLVTHPQWVCFQELRVKLHHCLIRRPWPKSLLDLTFLICKVRGVGYFQIVLQSSSILEEPFYGFPRKIYFAQSSYLFYQDYISIT